MPKDQSIKEQDRHIPDDRIPLHICPQFRGADQAMVNQSPLSHLKYEESGVA